MHVATLHTTSDLPSPGLAGEWESAKAGASTEMPRHVASSRARSLRLASIVSDTLAASSSQGRRLRPWWRSVCRSCMAGSHWERRCRRASSEGSLRRQSPDPTSNLTTMSPARTTESIALLGAVGCSTQCSYGKQAHRGWRTARAVRYMVWKVSTLDPSSLASRLASSFRIPSSSHPPLPSASDAFHRPTRSLAPPGRRMSAGSVYWTCMGGACWMIPVTGSTWGYACRTTVPVWSVMRIIDHSPGSLMSGTCALTVRGRSGTSRTSMTRTPPTVR
mmetsp:Transcript_8938/g.22171  ORF Transcript_8938/g.22171 Transcript_8938/m.22171 type:complete len:276 (-) Transcript_8938:783-1610(-)